MCAHLTYVLTNIFKSETEILSDRRVEEVMDSMEIVEPLFHGSEPPQPRFQFQRLADRQLLADQESSSRFIRSPSQQDPLFRPHIRPSPAEQVFRHEIQSYTPRPLYSPNQR